MVTQCSFRKAPGLVLENDRIRVAILEWGGKIASIQRNGFEYLAQGGTKHYRKPVFGGGYGEFDVSGFDDMLPNINEGYVKSGIWRGTLMPDHGEVWALTSRLTQEGEKVVSEVSGVYLPYRLWKEISLDGDTLNIQYRLSNPTEFVMPCAWAAHILINANENTRIRMRDDCGFIRNALDMHSRLGGYGTVHDWPECEDRNGNRYHIDRLDKRGAEVCEKYYFANALKNRVVYIKNPNMTIDFSSAATPYLGIWLNSSGYLGQYNIGIEPATAPMDSPEYAKDWGVAAELEPFETLRWHIAMTMSA